MYRIGVCIALCALAPVSVAGPINGGFFRNEKIGAAPWLESRRFRAGERATVQVANKDQDAANFHIAIYDAKGKLVVEDKNKIASKEDLVAVSWYPPREAEYKIEIKNLDGRINGCFITVK